jgi:hypothetical protein
LVTGITFRSSKKKKKRVTLTRQKKNQQGLSTNLTSITNNNMTSTLTDFQGQ